MTSENLVSYTDRLKGIFDAHYPAAIAGDVDATHICLRVIELHAKITHRL